MDSGNQYDSREVGLRVKQIAKQQGYTAQDLADRMKVQYDTVSRIYRGQSVTSEYICELSQILGVSTDYLLLGKEKDIVCEDDLGREANMKFLSGLSDEVLARAVLHAKVDLGIFSIQ